MNKAKLRVVANRVVLGLAILAILVGLFIYSEWGTVLIHARLL